MGTWPVAAWFPSLVRCCVLLPSHLSLREDLARTRGLLSPVMDGFNGIIRMLAGGSGRAHGPINETKVCSPEGGEEGWAGRFWGCFVWVLSGFNCWERALPCPELCLGAGSGMGGVGQRAGSPSPARPRRQLIRDSRQAEIFSCQLITNANKAPTLGCASPAGDNEEPLVGAFGNSFATT